MSEITRPQLAYNKSLYCTVVGGEPIGVTLLRFDYALGIAAFYNNIDDIRTELINAGLGEIAVTFEDIYNESEGFRNGRLAITRRRFYGQLQDYYRSLEENARKTGIG